MIDIYQTLKHPDNPRQFKCGDSLITLYNCPLKSKTQDIWSEHNYIIYVVEGKKVWHTPHGIYALEQGSCVFVKKGAAIVEQFFDGIFCLVMFFLPDDFIGSVLKSKSFPVVNAGTIHPPVMQIDCDASVKAFFQSMMLLFENSREPDPALLELKFRELILTLSDNYSNKELLTFFHCLANQPQVLSLQVLMEDNFRYNLKLDEFARLSNRSLSTFKRDFEKHFNCTPGKWLMEKRLHHAMNLLSNTDKTVTEVAFESGFENPSHFSRSFRNRFGFSPRSQKKAISAMAL